ncbi:D-glycero-beta-D-manno-heptose 1,7-bisphosphate 7-phosphatase [Thiohalobacter sp. IOR34]|uniref:D-glycero-beta-D-manno-heptose 1,7-bisphosphate 7-phosphatase n=1 Tax=Thiohalobacter sp. IOR34 TaxID=3057176 RepID=UPI0025AF34E8|nr:D-glycero-beta-D-manno-heptose 1,7-bisphosphate 7-phosphatase [Thiohalobacter sp. IOR34]WJW75513.1 D-glycero-beta-D-manno-heptose 1,7-bisphosphate 7-phosphatase [Thiohalobacter sp. IOR34]
MRLIILDRDGVINQDSEAYIKSPEEWHPIPRSLEAIAELNRADYRVVVATNQSGIGRGLYDLDTLARIHARMHQALAEVGGKVEAIFFCPHAPDEGCDCRKPRPGLLLDIASRLQVSLHGVPVIGDALRDLQAAQAVGASPILVRTGKGRDTEALAEAAGVPVYDDLAAAVSALLQQDGG